FLTEDAAFVLPGSMLATGVANFLHLREDSLGFVDARHASMIRRSPVIRRRSGVEEFEVDLRRTNCRLAPRPLALAGIVFVSKRPARGGAILGPLRRAEMLARLDRSQQYGAIHPGWSTFRSRLSRMNARELRRGKHPGEAADALRRLLE